MVQRRSKEGRFNFNNLGLNGYFRRMKDVCVLENLLHRLSAFFPRKKIGLLPSPIKRGYTH